MNQEKIIAYEILKEEYLPDIASTGYLLKHKKTGARVMLIENDDENKVFNIAFRTTPEDRTGVPHIMEHSVLCGSRDFPLKDPFVELVKGSLNTFLNAMTYPDKTCYPVASCNDQDFQNLIHVYLDAVFYPNIYQKKETFLQEGWNYHLEDVNGPLTLNGVVYNEMKGAYSSPDEVLEREIMNSILPDTTYGVDSGGDPKCIPELTYEAYLDFHRKYYHPSNSFIYLYGNMDMAEKLAFIDEKYLSAFDALEVDSEITLQEPFAEVQKLTREYPIGESESEEDNTYFAYSRVIGESGDAKLAMAFEILDYALLSAPGAPLKQALLDAGVGADVYGSFEDGIRQPYFTIVAKGAPKDKEETFLNIIEEVLTSIAEKGVDQKAIAAGINYFEFRYREADFSSFPKGLIFGLDIMGDWLYENGDPFAQVKRIALFEELKDAAAEGYFEELIRKYLLQNTHGSIVTLVPSKGLAARRDQELADKLEAYRQSLSAEELQAMVEATSALEAYQEAEDDPELLKCLPMLTREDIKKEVAPLYNEEICFDGSLFLYHDVRTTGIGYLDLLFDLDPMTEEEIHYLGLLKSVLGLIDTEHYSFGELFNEINAHTGGLHCGVEIFDTNEANCGYRAMFAMKGKALYGELPFLMKMAEEILMTSRLNDLKRLREIVAQTKSRAQAGLVSSGHGTAVLRAASYESQTSLFQDHLSGISYYQFIEKLDAEFDSRSEEIVSSLQKLLGSIRKADHFLVNYTGERESLETIEQLSLELKHAVREAEADMPAEEKAITLVPEQKNEGFLTSGQVQYVAQTGNFLRKGHAYTGALSILKVILGYDYLWTNIRVKGGAYGCMNGFKRNGDSFFVSYRDPHMKRTLDVYAGIPDYLRSFCADEREMTKYIIGTISSKDVPRTPQMMGSVSKSAYFAGVTREMLQQERDEILNAEEKDIQALAPLVEAILENGSICVVGSESGIKKDQDVLKEVKPLITC